MPGTASEMVGSSDGLKFSSMRSLPTTVMSAEGDTAASTLRGPPLTITSPRRIESPARSEAGIMMSEAMRMNVLNVNLLIINMNE